MNDLIIPLDLPRSPWDVGLRFRPRMMSNRIIGSGRSEQVTTITRFLFSQLGTDMRTRLSVLRTRMPSTSKLLVTELPLTDAAQLVKSTLIL